MFRKRELALASKQKPKQILEYGINEPDDYYGDGGGFVVRLVTQKDVVRPKEIGGWKNRYNDDGYVNRNKNRIWGAEFSTEDTCCGFPVMSGFTEVKSTDDYVKEIGTKLGEYLKAQCVYMAAYLPDTNEYRATRAILQHAGFKPGVKLTTTHGENYTNTRWEWFDGNPLALMAKPKK